MKLTETAQTRIDQAYARAAKADQAAAFAIADYQPDGKNGAEDSPAAHAKWLAAQKAQRASRRAHAEAAYAEAGEQTRAAQIDYSRAVSKRDHAAANAAAEEHRTAHAKWNDAYIALSRTTTE